MSKCHACVFALAVIAAVTFSVMFPCRPVVFFSMLAVAFTSP